MKKLSKKIIMVLSLLLAFVLLSTDTMTVLADVPYYTWTVGPDGYWVPSQTAYEPGESIKAGFLNPEDMFVYKNKIFVADTGNSRIVVLENNEIVMEFTDANLNKPTGISVNDEYIYVADYGNACVLLFNHDGTLHSRLDKPTEKTLGADTKFKPMKIGVDMRGNIYVVSEGSTSGLMQISEEGNFLGYFGANRTNTSLMMILQQKFFTEEQMAKLFKNIPSSPANIAVDSMGLIYTVTQGTSAAEQRQSIRKLSISGSDLFSTWVYSDSFVDVAVDKNFNVYAISSWGTIEEYDNYGNLVFEFGQKDTGTERVGLISNAVAIDVLDNGNLLVLDKTKGMIQFFEATEFAQWVHLGNAYYLDGRYEEAEEVWKYINKMNSAFLFSYEALGKASFKRQDYSEALELYRMAENVSGYSQAFWYARNEWIENNLGTAIIIIAVVMVLWNIVKKLDKEKRIAGFFDSFKQKLRGKKPVEHFLLFKMMLKKPFDVYYEMKYHNKTSWIFATLLYVWLAVLQITNLYVTSYIFDQRNPAYMTLFELIGPALLPLLLFVVCNYLVSTITGGEGKFKQVYCGTIYALAPILLFTFPIQLLTNVLTENEAFVYEFGQLILLVWSAVLLYLMVQELHSFSIKGTVKNILITIVTMLLLVLAAIMLYLLFGQLKDFVIEIFQEVKLHV